MNKTYNIFQGYDSGPDEYWIELVYDDFRVKMFYFPDGIMKRMIVFENKWPWDGDRIYEIFLDQKLPAEDHFEYNNDFYSAWNLDPGLYKGLGCLDDDWYEIYLYSGDTVNIDIYFKHHVGNLELQLYKSNHAFINVS